MSQIKILIVDDHQIVRQGIRSLLSNHPRFEIVGEAENGSMAMQQVEALRPDVTLLDIRMPGESGLEVLRRIRQCWPEVRVLMLTSFDDDEYVIGALKAGAQGFVLKSVSDEMLVNAIDTVYRGERALSPQITEQMVQWVVADQPPPAAAPARYTDSECRILRMLVDGASNAEIADQLYMSSTTVKRKLRKIFERMDVQTRAQAAAEAVRRGLV